MSQFQYQSEPASWAPTGSSNPLDNFLLWCFHLGASDVLLQSDEPAWVQVHGQWHTATQRQISHRDLDALLCGPLTRQANASSRLNSGDEMNFAYQVREDRAVQRRFRVNASSCEISGNSGLAVVLRTLPSAPPKLEDLDIEPEILPHLVPVNGLVIVTGVMGSGKSTLLAGVMRYLRETTSRKIRTYEAPIEFDLSAVANPLGPLVQMEIPSNLGDWEKAPRNASRSASGVILVGEANDRETMRGMLHLTQMGVAAYSTAHTQSVAETPSRIIDVFAASGAGAHDERLPVKSVLLSSLRLIIYQRLVPRRGGGRVALREFLAFDEGVRRELLHVPLEDLGSAIRSQVSAQGQTLLKSATANYEKGLIPDETFEALQQEFKGSV